MIRFILIAVCTFCYHLSVLAQHVANEEDWSELPKSINPGSSAEAPSDAVVLFDGTDLSQWSHADGRSPEWQVENGVLKIVPGTGDLISKEAFGDVQLHVEWMIPEEDHGNGNSGIYLQGRYEVQIFNSYQNQTEIYYNGQTGSLYKQFSPLVNASRPHGQWDSYDIIFTAPRFAVDGKLVAPAIFTVFHNGILIQHNAQLKGITTHEKLTQYEAHPLKQPLMIQDHGDHLHFRNIWLRQL